MRRRRAYPSIKLKGRVALVGSNWSVGSFAHFTADAISRWSMLRQAGFSLTDFDHILVYHPKTGSSRALLTSLELGDRLIEADYFVDYVCDELIFTTYPHLAPRFSLSPLWSVRDLLPPRRAGRRIYLSREGYARHPANGSEIESLLNRLDFETIPASDHLRALEVCREASVVVGVEGSNLFNILFCPPGARVVTLLWPGCPFSYISGLCAALDHAEGIVPASPGSSTEKPLFDLHAVADALEWATAG